jgi:hypothetical protein
MFFRNYKPSKPIKIFHIAIKFYIVFLHLLLCASAVFQRTSVASHTRGLFNLFTHSVGLLWTSDQSVAKASTYTRQHNEERRGQTSMP